MPQCNFLQVRGHGRGLVKIGRIKFDNFSIVDIPLKTSIALQTEL
jgi:hypothetical protein